MLSFFSILSQSLENCHSLDSALLKFKFQKAIKAFLCLMSKDL